MQCLGNLGLATHAVIVYEGFQGSNIGFNFVSGYLYMYLFCMCLYVHVIGFGLCDLVRYGSLEGQRNMLQQALNEE